MKEKHTWVRVVALLPVVAFPLLAGAFFQEKGESTASSQESLLPPAFPIPKEAVREIKDPRSTALEYRVGTWTPKDLVLYFKRELPARGFRIAAQNPPRLHDYDSPVTLIVRKEKGQMFSLQILSDQDGRGRFIIRR